MASIVARSRPSEKFGTDSSGSTGVAYVDVRAYYDRRAPEYDEWYRGEGPWADRDAAEWDAELGDLLDAIAALPPATTIDVACGTGFLTAHLRGELTGLDRSARMLEVARARLPGARLVEGDALDLPFPGASFDRVFSGHFYGHLEPEDASGFLSEARRVGGELVVVDASQRHADVAQEWQERRLGDRSRWSVFKRYFTPERLIRELGGGEVLHEGRWFVMVRS
jgi:demethylmenaquinone methyltransferase/2-methoxy-6-polyprenyl-1,4-benzoquinol methylase